MPLSDHEQRMLDQIESALYAEDPKFASSVRGGAFRAPSTKRRLQGGALFVVGLAMLVCGVAVKATMIGSFPILSVLGFIVMFGGVVFAITGPRTGGKGDRSASAPGRSAPRAAVAPSPAGWKTASASASTNSRSPRQGQSTRTAPFSCFHPHIPPLPPHQRCNSLLSCGHGEFRGRGVRALRFHDAAIPLVIAARWGDLRNSQKYLAQSGGLWGKVADNGATGVPFRARLQQVCEVARCSSAPTRQSSTTRGD